MDIPFSGKLLRLWIDRDDVADELGELKVLESLSLYIETYNPKTTQLMEYVKNVIPRVNAAQVKECNPNGLERGQVVYYVDFADNHG